MEFSHRKLPRSEAAKLKRSSVDSIKPFALLLTQVYVFMKRNAKFLAIKGPLDFFSESELEKLKSFGTFFVPEFVQFALPFRDAAKSVRLTLSWRPRSGAASSSEGEFPTYSEVALSPTPFELSDAVLKIVGPLWGAGGVIEPYFVTVFSHEICDPLPTDWMQKLREADHLKFENTLFIACWTVFLALHLGKCDLQYLSRVRSQVFQRSFPEIPCPTPLGPMDHESEQLADLAQATFVDPLVPFRMENFEDRSERLAQMLKFRFQRVLREFVKKDRIAPSVQGEKGLIVGAAG